MICDTMPELHWNAEYKLTYILKLTTFLDAFMVWWSVYFKFTTDLASERISKIG